MPSWCDVAWWAQDAGDGAAGREGYDRGRSVGRRRCRKGRGPFEAWIADELRRACVQHGLPEPLEVSPVPHTTTTASPVHWMEFTRSRKGQSPLRGHEWRLSFAEPVRGPFAVAALAHFGLGLFVPAR